MMDLDEEGFLETVVVRGGRGQRGVERMKEENQVPKPRRSLTGRALNHDD